VRVIAIACTLGFVLASSSAPARADEACPAAVPRCAVRDIKVKTDHGKVAVLVGSRELSRDCFGGTATTDYLTLYDLIGGQLVMQRELSVSWH
jgi:hypothetical protein